MRQSVMSGAMTHAERLGRALADRELVEIEHRPSDESFFGWVLAVGAQWFVVAAVDTTVITLNGFQCLRVDDVAVDAPTFSFVERAMDHQGLTPPAAPDLHLDGTAKLLESAAARYPLVAVHTSDEVLIGVPVPGGDDVLELVEVDADAEWMDELQVVPLEEIQRVDVGGRYEQLLDELAGPPPG